MSETLLSSIQLDETKFFDEIKMVHFEEVRRMLVKNPCLCEVLNHLGLNALEYAIVLQKTEIVYFLIEVYKPPLRDALLFAVLVNNMDILKKLAKSYPREGKSTEKSLFFPKHMTALQLAAIVDNYDAYDVLEDYGHNLIHLHFSGCGCGHCYGANEDKDMDTIGRTMAKLDLYAAMTSEASMLQEDNPDPVIDSFMISDDLAKLSSSEPECASEYETLLEKGKLFVSQFIGKCHNADEVRMLLEKTEGAKNNYYSPLPRFDVAVDTEQKYFLAEFRCLVAIEQHWMGAWNDWKTVSYFVKFQRLLQYTLFQPIVATWQTYSLGESPSSGKSPVAKCLADFGSYFYFLTFLCFLSRRPTFYNVDLLLTSFHLFVPYIYICLYVVGLFTVRMTELWRFGFRLFSKCWWNGYDVFLCAVYFVTFNSFVNHVLHDRKVNLLTRAHRSSWPEDDPILLFEAMLAFCIVLSAWKLFYFMQFNPIFGRLLLSISRSTKMLILYAVMFFVCINSFAIGLNYMYSHYKHNVDYSGEYPVEQPEYFTSIFNAVRYLYWAWYGYMHPLEKLKIVVGSTVQTQESIKHTLVQSMGEFIAALYHFIVIVALLHLMTSMMAIEASALYKTKQVDFKYNVCRFRRIYFHDSRNVPPPFCLIVLILSLIRLMLSLFCLDKKGMERFSVWSPNYDTPTESEEANLRYEELISKLTQRIRAGKQSKFAMPDLSKLGDKQSFTF